MVFFVTQKLDQPVVVLGIGRLAAAALAEHELIVQRLTRLLKAVAVHVNAVLRVFRAAKHHMVARLQIAVFDDGKRLVGADDDAGVHAALLCQTPFAFDLKILRIHGGAVVALGRNAVALDHSPRRVGRAAEQLLCKIRRVIFREFKRHVCPSLL